MRQVIRRSLKVRDPRPHVHLFDAIGDSWRRRTNRSDRRPTYGHGLYQTMFCRCGITKVILIHP